MFKIVLVSTPADPKPILDELRELTGLRQRKLGKPGDILLSGTDPATVEQQAEALRIVGADVRVEGDEEQAAEAGNDDGAEDGDDGCPETTRDPGARSSAYMLGRDAFAGSGSRTPPHDFDEAQRADFLRGFDEAAELVKSEPGLVREVAPTCVSCNAAPAKHLEVMGSPTLCDGCHERTKHITLTSSTPAPLNLSEERAEGYCDIALDAEHCSHEDRAKALHEHREWMLVNGIGDAIVARDRRVLSGMKVKEIALICWAAREIRDGARATRDEAPTQDRAPRENPPAAASGKPGKAPKPPKPPKVSAGWLKAIGTTGVSFLIAPPAGTVAEEAEGIDEAEVLAMLQKHAFNRKAEEIKEEPAWGFCDVRDAFEVDFGSVPVFGDEVVIGLRRDLKKAPRTTLRAQATRQATAEAKLEGRAHPTKPRISEIFEDLLARELRQATPQSSVTPITFDGFRTFTVWTTSEKAAVAASNFLGRLGTVTRVDTAEQATTPLRERNPAATDIRKLDGVGEGAADLGADFLLWLLGRAESGTGAMRIESPGFLSDRLEWWLENDAVLERETPDTKALRVKLAGAPTEGGSLSAALADGATLQSGRFGLQIDEKKFYVTFDGLNARAFGLPATCTPDGTEESLDAAVCERLALRQQADLLVAELRRAFVAERLASWNQRVQAVRRQLGTEIAKRWGFDPKTGQGLLFSHVFGGEQASLVNETTMGAAFAEAAAPRGRRGRDPIEAVRNPAPGVTLVSHGWGERDRPVEGGEGSEGAAAADGTVN
jgi:hypothetical protein